MEAKPLAIILPNNKQKISHRSTLPPLLLFFCSSNLEGNIRWKTEKTQVHHFDLMDYCAKSET